MRLFGHIGRLVDRVGDVGYADRIVCMYVDEGWFGLVGIAFGADGQPHRQVTFWPHFYCL